MPRFPLSDNWLFHPRFDHSHHLPFCDESGFEPVVLPHTTRLVPLAGFDERIYQGVSSYRRHLRLPDGLPGSRAFIDFDGIMASAKVFLDGHPIGSHQGGYTPFSVELTGFPGEPDSEHVLSVEVDSREIPSIPPFGNQLDYLTYGGIYRDAWLRIMPSTFIAAARIAVGKVMTDRPMIELAVELDGDAPLDADFRLRIDIRAGESLVATSDRPIGHSGPRSLSTLLIRCDAPLRRWDIDDPFLHTASITLVRNGRPVDQMDIRFGAREARFEEDGFHLNGRRVPLRGLNRHQEYPWVGYAMPARVQCRDADILRHELKLNIVRTSHYPQSPDFLDRCDEIGLLVFEEIPGWQFIGDEAWKDLCRENLRAMIRRDVNHPSIVLWGVRINESVDDDVFYRDMNRIAHEMDPSRQTGGVRCHLQSPKLEDVFTYNDFDPVQLKTPHEHPWLITEYAGHMFPTKHTDNLEHVTEHIRRHAHIQSQAAGIAGISGAIGWCAFDYHTHADFGSGDRICHHGVCDMFRLPKKAAAVYRSQCPPEEEIVLEPGFSWCLGDRPAGGSVGRAYILSNCDRLRVFLGDEPLADLLPDRESFPNLPHPPFRFGPEFDRIWCPRIRPMRIEAYIGDRLVRTRTLTGNGIDARFILRADDEQLVADGRDCTRVWFIVADEEGIRRPHAIGAITFSLEGPAGLVGDNPFALVGGGGAVWIRAGRQPGIATLSAHHPVLGTESVTVRIGG